MTLDDEDAIAELQRQVRAQGELIARLYAHLGLGQLNPDNVGIGGDYPDVVAAIKAGNRIEAIRLYRGYTGAKLRDSKNAVEAIARSL